MEPGVRSQRPHLGVRRRVLLFANRPPGRFAKIIADLREEVIEPGTVVCTAGEPANDFFLIRSGEVLVYVNHANGGRELIDTVGANHGFGEAALVRERRRAATIVARTCVELWRLSKDKFATVIDENLDLVLHFTGILLDRCRPRTARSRVSCRLAARRTAFDGVPMPALFVQ